MNEDKFWRKILNPRHLAYLGVFAAIVLSSYFIVVSGIIENWALRGGYWWLALAFVAGLLFTSFSTIPLATAVFISLARAGMPIEEMALLGGFAALIGDTGLLAAFKISILDDSMLYLAKKTHGAFEKMMHRPLVKLGAIIVGGIVIASPLPDELGMALMGMAKCPMRYIMLASFLCNAGSIALIGYLSR